MFFEVILTLITYELHSILILAVELFIIIFKIAGYVELL